MANVERRIVPPEQASKLDKSSHYLKVHMPRGNVYILDEWFVDEDLRVVHGQGELLDTARKPIEKGTFAISIDSVAVFETNVLTTSPALIPLTIVTAASIAVTIYCATNPKACFGSCPTFYVESGDSMRLDAEGFSASIAPSLEATDVDALFSAHPNGRRFEIEMRNEALETHVVRSVNVIASPRRGKDRVVKDTRGNLWIAGAPVEPTLCSGPEGDCRAALSENDGEERSSLADETDLKAREIIDVQFEDVPDGPVGLLIASRQSLLSTYLLYETLANMGTDIGRWLAMIENAEVTANPLIKALGEIDVSIRDEDEWLDAGSVGEHGPLATDVTVLPLEGDFTERPLRVRLSLTKGNWRIDHVAIVALTGVTEGIRIEPEQVISRETGLPDDGALVKLLDPEESLATLPGDVYTLVYELPSDGEYELFLESRGYYLEWMRTEWLPDENAQHVAQMIFSPADAMKRLAPAFKEVEADMEDAFWSSKYAKP